MKFKRLFNTWTYTDGPVEYTVWWCPDPVFDQDRRSSQSSWFLTVVTPERSIPVSLDVWDSANAALAITKAKRSINRVRNASVVQQAERIVSEAWAMPEEDSR